MFRFGPTIKVLAIHLNSFHEMKLADWNSFEKHYQCCYLTSDSDVLGQANDNVIVYKSDIEHFLPTPALHEYIATKWKVKSHEILYVSAEHEFLRNALGFPSGTAWITEKVVYEYSGYLPDLICDSVTHLFDALTHHVCGFYGETSVFPEIKIRGSVVPVSYPLDRENSFRVYSMGRVFGARHYMHSIHPYSTAIYVNKFETSKSFHVFDSVFAELLTASLRKIVPDPSQYGLCAVPPHLGKENRFFDIVNQVSEVCGMENLGRILQCVKEIKPQKRLSFEARKNNVRDAYVCTSDLQGKRIILIDDIVTSGETITECVRTLLASGAESVECVVLAINQKEVPFQYSDEPQVLCANCGNNMKLQVNSETRDYYFRCENCHKTESFVDGWNKLLGVVEKE